MLNKSAIAKDRQCKRQLWLDIYKPNLSDPDDVTIARLAEGNRIGEIARSLLPNGVLIATHDLQDALIKTSEALAQKEFAIFEAAFQTDDLLVRTDLLVPETGGHRLVEIKSSTEVKDHHIVDAAIQTWAMINSGVRPNKVAIGHINNQFRYEINANYLGLFKEVDVTNQVESLLNEVPEWIASARSTIESEEMPIVMMGKQCQSPNACSYISYCSSLETITEFPVSILPRAGKKFLEKLAEEGIVDVREIPDNYLENERHKIVRDATITGQPYLSKMVALELDMLPYPRYYLDFEAVAPAVPIWLNTKPYQQVPFQWSCHIENITDGDLDHTEFLSDTNADPRREFSESLIHSLGDQGAIIVYNATYESTRIKELAAHFPDLSNKLLTLIDRIVDLWPLAQQNYYHPAMKGSWSIKAVLPTLSDLDYKTLAVGNGGLAQVAFSEMISPDTTEDKRQTIRRNLLAYCGQDTLAMVHIAHKFSGKK